MRIDAMGLYQPFRENDENDAATPARAPTGLECELLEVGAALAAVLSFRLEARRGGPSSSSSSSSSASRALTSAEAKVMKALFEGKSNDDIARERGTSPRTIANQIASIFRKHGVGSRAELVARYLQVG